MAGGKQTPRQKMINLMYLVFIAMMAMNVDREVLRAFENVYISLKESTQLIKKNNDTFYDNITRKSQTDASYVKINQQAQGVKKSAQDAYQSVESMIASLITATEYTEPKEGEETKYNSLQNSDAVQKLFFATETKGTKAADDMLSKLEAYKTVLLGGGSPDDKKRIEQVFDFKKIKNKTWLQSHFYEQPMIAALTNLKKIQSDIRTEEANRVRDLLANKLQEDIELKAFTPIVSAPKYVQSGEQFDVVIGFGAYDNTLKGSINLNGSNVALTDGKGIVKVTAGGSGTQTLNGSITYNTPAGPKTEKFTQTYEIVSNVVKDMPTGGTIMADKMNVVYRGVDNPMSGSVTGVEPSTVNMTASSGSLSRSGKGWSYKPGAGSTVKFTISGKTNQGKVVSTSVDYRIKNIPKPEGQIRGQNVLTLPQSSLVNQTIGAAIPDFEFPVSFTVTGFKVKVPGAATSVVSGNKLGGAASVLSRAKRGDQITIFDISATAHGIEGKRNISPIVINVQ